MRIVLIGGGGHASDVLGAIEEVCRMDDTRRITVAGILADESIDDRRFRHRGVLQIGSVDEVKSVDATHYIVCVGFSKGRKAVFSRIHDCGLQPATIVHPNAYIPKGVPTGSGTVVLSGVSVSPMAEIGNHVYLSHGALIGHDCIIHDFVSVMPGASISGDTVLDDASLIGANATVIQGIRVGKNATVGAGAVVVRDVEDDTTVVGNPAKVLAKRDA